MIPKSDAAGRRIALFPGSFNPFTRGHESLVTRALSTCDGVTIAIGINIEKKDADTESRVRAIRDLYAGDPRIDVVTYSELTGELAKRLGCAFILRGVRNTADFEYEMNMADVNRRLFGIETVLLPALPELAWISSSTARELARFGHDISELLHSGNTPSHTK
jgi:pantetheine-phosphate adenylyltransferase